MERETGSNRINENGQSDDIDYVRVPVIQKLVEAEIGSSKEADRLVPQSISYNGYHQVDSPALSSSDEIIVV